MKVYTGAGWVAAGSSVNGTAQRYDYVVGTASGSYDGNTTTFPAIYDAGYVDVYLNGIKLVNTTDFTATSGSSIVLASAATTNDVINIVGYGTFTIANFSIGTANDVDLSGGVTAGQMLAYNSTTSKFEPSTKIATTSTGVDVTGNVVASGVISATGGFTGDLTGTATVASTVDVDQAGATLAYFTSTDGYVDGVYTIKAQQLIYASAGTLYAPAFAIPSTSNGTFSITDGTSVGRHFKFGSSGDVKVFYDGTNNIMNMELEIPAVSFNITDNGTPKFVFTKSTGNLAATSYSTANWTFSEDGSGNLIFSTGGTNVAKLDTSGNLTVIGNVTAFGTI